MKDLPENTGKTWSEHNMIRFVSVNEDFCTINFTMIFQAREARGQLALHLPSLLT